MRTEKKSMWQPCYVKPERQTTMRGQNCGLGTGSDHLLPCSEG